MEEPQTASNPDPSPSDPAPSPSPAPSPAPAPAQDDATAALLARIAELERANQEKDRILREKEEREKQQQDELEQQKQNVATLERTLSQKSFKGTAVNVDADADGAAAAEEEEEEEEEGEEEDAGSDGEYETTEPTEVNDDEEEQFVKVEKPTSDEASTPTPEPVKVPNQEEVEVEEEEEEVKVREEEREVKEEEKHVTAPRKSVSSSSPSKGEVLMVRFFRPPTSMFGLFPNSTVIADVSGEDLIAAKLQRGDAILAINGEYVEDAASVMREVGKIPVGALMEMTVRSAGPLPFKSNIDPYRYLIRAVVPNGKLIAFKRDSDVILNVYAELWEQLGVKKGHSVEFIQGRGHVDSATLYHQFAQLHEGSIADIQFVDREKESQGSITASAPPPSYVPPSSSSTSSAQQPATGPAGGNPPPRMSSNQHDVAQVQPPPVQRQHSNYFKRARAAGWFTFFAIIVTAAVVALITAISILAQNDDEEEDNSTGNKYVGPSVGLSLSIVVWWLLIEAVIRKSSSLRYIIDVLFTILNLLIWSFVFVLGGVTQNGTSQNDAAVISVLVFSSLFFLAAQGIYAWKRVHPLAMKSNLSQYFGWVWFTCVVGIYANAFLSFITVEDSTVGVTLLRIIGTIVAFQSNRGPLYLLATLSLMASPYIIDAVDASSVYTNVIYSILAGAVSLQSRTTRHVWMRASGLIMCLFVLSYEVYSASQVLSVGDNFPLEITLFITMFTFIPAYLRSRVNFLPSFYCASLFVFTLKYMDMSGGYQFLYFLLWVCVLVVVFVLHSLRIYSLKRTAERTGSLGNEDKGVLWASSFDALACVILVFANVLFETYRSNVLERKVSNRWLLLFTALFCLVWGVLLENLVMKQAALFGKDNPLKSMTERFTAGQPISYVCFVISIVFSGYVVNETHHPSTTTAMVLAGLVVLYSMHISRASTMTPYCAVAYLVILAGFFLYAIRGDLTATEMSLVAIVAYILFVLSDPHLVDRIRRIRLIAKRQNLQRAATLRRLEVQRVRAPDEEQVSYEDDVEVNNNNGDEEEMKEMKVEEEEVKEQQPQSQSRSRIASILMGEDDSVVKDPRLASNAWDVMVLIFSFIAYIVAYSLHAEDVTPTDMFFVCFGPTLSIVISNMLYGSLILPINIIFMLAIMAPMRFIEIGTTERYAFTLLSMAALLFVYTSDKLSPACRSNMAGSIATVIASAVLDTYFGLSVAVVSILLIFITFTADVRVSPQRMNVPEAMRLGGALSIEISVLSTVAMVSMIIRLLYEVEESTNVAVCFGFFYFLLTHIPYVERRLFMKAPKNLRHILALNLEAAHVAPSGRNFAAAVDEEEVSREKKNVNDNEDSGVGKVDEEKGAEGKPHEAMAINVKPDSHMEWVDIADSTAILGVHKSFSVSATRLPILLAALLLRVYEHESEIDVITLLLVLYILFILIKSDFLYALSLPALLFVAVVTHIYRNSSHDIIIGSATICGGVTLILYLIGRFRPQLFAGLWATRRPRLTHLRETYFMYFSLFVILIGIPQQSSQDQIYVNYAAPLLLFLVMLVRSSSSKLNPLYPLLFAVLSQTSCAVVGESTDSRHQCHDFFINDYLESSGVYCLLWGFFLRHHCSKITDDPKRKFYWEILQLTVMSTGAWLLYWSTNGIVPAIFFTFYAVMNTLEASKAFLAVVVVEIFIAWSLLIHEADSSLSIYDAFGYGAWITCGISLSLAGLSFFLLSKRGDDDEPEVQESRKYIVYGLVFASFVTALVSAHVTLWILPLIATVILVGILITQSEDDKFIPFSSEGVLWALALSWSLVEFDHVEDAWGSMAPIRLILCSLILLRSLVRDDHRLVIFFLAWVYAVVEFSVCSRGFQEDDIIENCGLVPDASPESRLGFSFAYWVVVVVLHQTYFEKVFVFSGLSRVSGNEHNSQRAANEFEMEPVGAGQVAGGAGQGEEERKRKEATPQVQHVLFMLCYVTTIGTAGLLHRLTDGWVGILITGTFLFALSPRRPACVVLFTWCAWLFSALFVSANSTYDDFDSASFGAVVTFAVIFLWEVFAYISPDRALSIIFGARPDDHRAPESTPLFSLTWDPSPIKGSYVIHNAPALQYHNIFLMAVCCVLSWTSTRGTLLLAAVFLISYSRLYKGQKVMAFFTPGLLSLVSFFCLLEFDLDNGESRHVSGIVMICSSCLCSFFFETVIARHEDDFAHLYSFGQSIHANYYRVVNVLYVTAGAIMTLDWTLFSIVCMAVGFVALVFAYATKNVPLKILSFSLIAVGVFVLPFAGDFDGTEQAIILIVASVILIVAVLHLANELKLWENLCGTTDEAEQSNVLRQPRGGAQSNVRGSSSQPSVAIVEAPRTVCHAP